MSVTSPSPGRAKKGKSTYWPKGKKRIPKRQHRYRWASPIEPDDMHDILEFYLLDSKRRATDRYPAVPVMPESDDASNLPRTLNPYNPENRAPPAPPAPTDPVDPVDPVDPKPGGRKKVHKPKPPKSPRHSSSTVRWSAWQGPSRISCVLEW
ncbi:hypothetical protein NPX13_g11396 [Xylaria arbuscula]|uniref:Uncharacterized protein n=1 Tax=Xylaria arbuscula TaxID=114810 RepID=A0A9W8N301_9PEZI|nr:hypothetical protein NPX13_g11396 [Xylaria arbuscula]